MKTPILGSSYVARSVNAADNRMVNLFPEIVPEGGKEPAFLQRAPGLVDTAYITTSAYAVRGMYAWTNTYGRKQRESRRTTQEGGLFTTLGYDLGKQVHHPIVGGVDATGDIG